MKLRQSFTDFIFATNTDGSGKAASYVRALDMLGPILTKHYPNPIIGVETQFAATASKSKKDKEDFFMAIADDIGFDATGKPTKVNELDAIGAELAKFISKERGDE